MYSITEENVKILLSEKDNVFSRPLLERNCMHGLISIENISFSRNCDIKAINAKSVTDASIMVMFICKNSDTLEMKHSLLNSPIVILRYDFISGQLILLTNPIHRITGQCVNISGKRLFCDRALLSVHVYKKLHSYQFNVNHRFNLEFS